MRPNRITNSLNTNISINVSVTNHLAVIQMSLVLASYQHCTYAGKKRKVFNLAEC